MGYTHLLGFEYTCLCKHSTFSSSGAFWRSAALCRAVRDMRSGANIYFLFTRNCTVNWVDIEWDETNSIRKYIFQGKMVYVLWMSSGCHSIAGATLMLYGFRLMHLYLFFHAKHPQRIGGTVNVWDVDGMKIAILLYSLYASLAHIIKLFYFANAIHMTIENDKCILAGVWDFQKVDLCSAERVEFNIHTTKNH